VAITQIVAIIMKRQFSACRNTRTMYPSIFDSFPVIRTAIAKNRRSHVSQPTFLFPLEPPLCLLRNILHELKENSMLAKPLAACTYLSSIVSELYVIHQCVSPKIAIFTYRMQPTLLFPIETPLRLSRDKLHGWKDNSMLAKPLAACTYLSSTVSELYDALKSMRKSKNRYFYHIFVSPGDGPWDNHAKCCMDGKRIRCLGLQIFSLHVPI